jgi:hypothetical protein
MLPSWAPARSVEWPGLLTALEFSVCERVVPSRLMAINRWRFCRAPHRWQNPGTPRVVAYWHDVCQYGTI